MIRIDKLTKSVTKALEKKPYLELITVVLTIPVLITVIILNISNLLPKPGKATSTPTPEKQNQTVIHEREVTTVEKVITQPPAKNPEQCTKGIGPIEVSFPQEGDTSSNNPLCIDISYKPENYCAVVWAYKINGGSLSDYSNNVPCLYNLPSGSNTFTLQIKSLVSNETKTIERHFNYISNTTPVPSSGTSASSSATSQ